MDSFRGPFGVSIVKRDFFLFVGRIVSHAAVICLDTVGRIVA